MGSQFSIFVKSSLRIVQCSERKLCSQDGWRHPVCCRWTRCHGYQMTPRTAVTPQTSGRNATMLWNISHWQSPDSNYSNTAEENRPVTKSQDTITDKHTHIDTHKHRHRHTDRHADTLEEARHTDPRETKARQSLSMLQFRLGPSACMHQYLRPII